MKKLSETLALMSSGAGAVWMYHIVGGTCDKDSMHVILGFSIVLLVMSLGVWITGGCGRE
jgi:hypothetical protein